MRKGKKANWFSLLLSHLSLPKQQGAVVSEVKLASFSELEDITRTEKLHEVALVATGGWRSFKI